MMTKGNIIAFDNWISFNIFKNILPNQVFYHVLDPEPVAYENASFELMIYSLQAVHRIVWASLNLSANYWISFDLFDDPDEESGDKF